MKRKGGRGKKKTREREKEESTISLGSDPPKTKATRVISRLARILIQRRNVISGGGLGSRTRGRDTEAGGETEAANNSALINLELSRNN